MKIVSFLLFVSLFANAQTYHLADAIAKEKNLEEEPALFIYQKLLLNNAKDVKLLTASSFLYSKIGSRKKSNVQQTYFASAKKNAELAYSLQPNNAEVNYLLSLVYGNMALISSVKDKITYSRLVKKHVDIAIKLNTNYAYAWHLLGRYNMEVSKLNSIQLAAVNALYGGLPAGDVATAITCFEKCRQLDAGFLTNLVDLQKAYITNKQQEKAASLKPAIKNAKPRFFSEIGMQ